MLNHQKIIARGRLQGIIEDIEGESVLANFEVIEIVDENNPYPTLLGIDWVINMKGVINLKKRKMIFEKKSLRIVVPLEPIEGLSYTETVQNYGRDNNLDCIYKITARQKD